MAVGDVRGGFTAHDPVLGWRGSCACGWVGPWRGSMLTWVEADVLEHRDDCFEQGFERGNLGATYERGPGGAGNAGPGPADHWRVDMQNRTSAVNEDANGGDR